MTTPPASPPGTRTECVSAGPTWIECHRSSCRLPCGTGVFSGCLYGCLYGCLCCWLRIKINFYDVLFCSHNTTILLLPEKDLIILIRGFIDKFSLFFLNRRGALMRTTGAKNPAFPRNPFLTLQHPQVAYNQRVHWFSYYGNGRIRPRCARTWGMEKVGGAFCDLVCCSQQSWFWAFFVHKFSNFTVRWSDGMRRCRSDWPGLCLFCCYQPLWVVSQQSWFGFFFFFS